MDWLDEEWENKRYFLIDAPTGVGKSAIAMAAAKTAGRGFLLTSTKALQDQYLEAFPYVNSLKGKGNYTCAINPIFKVDHAVCVADKKQKGDCMDNGVCHYYNARNRALNGDFMITSYAYYLMAVECGPLRKRGEPSLRREVMICDEAHELDTILADFIGFEINCATILKDHSIDLMSIFDVVSQTNYLSHDNMVKKCATLITEKITPTLAAYDRVIERILNTALQLAGGDAKKISSQAVIQAKEITNLKDKLDRLFKKMERFVQARAGTEDEWLITPKREERKILFSPLVGRVGFNDYIACHADKVILMSASLGDPKQLAIEMGIPLEEMTSISVGTPFDPDKSPVIYTPLLDMGMHDLEDNMPIAINAVKEVMDAHPNEKGIIHSGNYKISARILNDSSASIKKRLIGKANSNRGTDSNEELIEQHSEAKTPTVLISPSMHTGVDLKGDLSRFQIIVKLPWLNLMDPRIKKKSESNEWYVNEMLKRLIQACGRSTRSEDDHSITYILDRGFTRIMNLNSHLLPKWFLDRIHVNN
jgi:Rad3-related DNA helicase